MKSKRVVIISDLHCGHVAGLTPPGWQLQPIKTTKEEMGKHKKWVKLERALWDKYVQLIRRIRPIDLLVVNGDCIDGRGEKSAGVELITTNRNEQCNMAVKCIRRWHAPKIIMTYGTDYHVGSGEDYEDIIAETVGSDKIGAHEWVNVNGMILDLKHHINSSSVPHASGTAVMRDALWNSLWAEKQEQPKADMIVRSHVHQYFRFETAIWSGLITPALQGMGSRYGSRRMSKRVDWGLFWMDVRGKYDYDPHPEITRFHEQSAKAIKI